MAFREVRFPVNVGKGLTGGPMFVTQINATVSGKESRDSPLAYPKHRWGDVTQGVLKPADFDSVKAFFMAVARGRQYGFRFKDWMDYTATHSNGIVTALSSTTFQAFKRYSSNGYTMDRVVQKIVTGSTQINVSGISTAHTVDVDTGIFTIASAPSASNVTWSGEFDVPVRFDTDQMEAKHLGRNPTLGQLHEWAGIGIVEILP